MTDLTPQKPKADVLSIEDLIEKLTTGQIRIPYFQRSLRWSERDNIDLFDSVYKGYPIGTLLMWKKHAEEDIFEIGPIKIKGEENPNAWWVIDGQQRLTALGAAALLNEKPHNHNDKYFIYFNPQDETFISEKSVKNDSKLVPLNKMIDSAVLMDWIFNNPIGQNSELRKIVLEASKRIREYKIPIYIITSKDDYAPRVIFNRLNNMGKSMRVSEVFDALSGKKDNSPGRLDELSNFLEKELKWGSINENVLLQASLAIKGKNVTQKFNTLNESELKDFNNIFPELHKAFERTVYFLIKESKIPHGKLLPYISPLIVLPRFFHFHPQPNRRTITLLRRWVWRGMLSGIHAPQERAVLRNSVKAINKNFDEELNAYNLLKLVTDKQIDPPSASHNFNLNSAKTKILLLILQLNNPRDLDTGEKIDISDLINEHASKATSYIYPNNKFLANIIFQIPSRFLLDRIINCNNKDILDSHLINQVCLKNISEKGYNQFIKNRIKIIDEYSWIVAKKMAEWNQNDRPSIDLILGDKVNK